MNKKIISLFCVAIVVVNICSFSAFAISKETIPLEAQSNTLIMKDKQEIKDYLKSQNLEYDSNIVEIVVYVEKSKAQKTPIKIKSFENDYFAKNIKVINSSM